jgi:hypothetical protein
MAATIAAVVAGYVVVSLLLLSLNLTSRWAWPVKAGAIVVTTGFFAWSYLAISGMLGWATTAPLPERFQLVWAKVVEPDKLRSDPGVVYMWVEALDENNVPSDRPRAFRLPYSDELADLVAGAQKEREQGIDVAGTVEYGEEVEDTRARMGEIEEGSEQTSRMDTVPFMDEAMRITFQDLPPVVLPDKPPL